MLAFREGWRSFKEGLAGGRAFIPKNAFGVAHLLRVLPAS